MSVRLIELLERLVGRMRGGLNVSWWLSMVIFSASPASKWPMSRRSGRC